MWSPGKNATYTVHVEDVAGAAWAAAHWMAQLGRQAADEKAGVEIISYAPQTTQSPELIPKNQKVVAPVFNVTDDSNSTHLNVGQTITSIFGTTFEFFNMLETTVMKFIDDDHVDEINDLHVNKWAEMRILSQPPVANEHLTAYMDKYALDKHSIPLSNGRMKTILGYQLRKPLFTKETIIGMVEQWKEERTFPCLE